MNSAGTGNLQPVVRYTTAQGQTFHLRRRGGVKITIPVSGRKVPVWYDPEHPEQFQVQVIWIERHGSLCFVAAAALVAFVGLLLLLPTLTGAA
nr:DUF3592 domain-containing protein [Kineosporia babensis]